jgi:hypothetical protein
MQAIAIPCGWVEDDFVGFCHAADYISHKK